MERIEEFLTATLVIHLLLSALGTIAQLYSVCCTKEGRNSATPLVILVWFAWGTGSFMWFFYGLMVEDGAFAGVAVTGLVGALENFTVFVILTVLYCRPDCMRVSQVPQYETVGSEMRIPGKHATAT
jgi:uncharacterized protein with PQ loop repeat